MTEYIRAPFNFVPVSSKVFFPGWADQVSQDVPFSDALSGTIHLKITAKTPMFIRNGHTESDEKEGSNKWRSFSNENGKYFIPATSIKGEVRNILEIMSFSKLRLDQSAKFAQREWDNPELYTIKSIAVQSTIRCGWLKETDSGYEITDCGKPFRINHLRIDEYLGGHTFENTFSYSKGIDLNKETRDGFDPKTASFKYSLVEKIGKSLEDLTFSNDDEYTEAFQMRRVRVDANGKQKGTIVLTGQPDKWKWPRQRNGGKFWEFVFPDEGENPVKHPLSEEEFMHFRFIYRDSPEWKDYSRKLTEKGGKGLPVFFRFEGNKLRDFGMAYLYKLPYEKSPYERLPLPHRDTEHHDLAECIFGYTSKEQSLRGRVHFGSAFSKNARPEGEVRLVLNSPKASYYPLYIRQKGKDGQVPEKRDRKGKPVPQYATYNDGSLSGWKRYHVRRKPWTGEGVSTGSDRLDTIIYPVKAGSEFTSDITFHNLRPVELGALLSALTFHNTKGCYHQLGQGKPYGFGKCVYDVGLDAEHAASAGYYLGLFEEAMKDFEKDWLQSEQITSLLTMAKEEVDNKPEFEYMVMSNDRRKNEFLQAKMPQAREYLEPAAERLGKKDTAAALEGELRPERQEEMKELVKTVLGRLSELGGEPDAEIAGKLQKFENDAGARLTVASLRNECEAKGREKREQEELKAQAEREAEEKRKREQAEAEAKREEDSRAVLSAGLKAFLGDAPLKYGQWCGKLKKWNSLISKEGRTSLDKDEQAAAIAALKPACSNPKAKKDIKWKEASKLVGRTVTEDIVKKQKG